MGFVENGFFGTVIHIVFELSESLPILSGKVAYSWENATDPWLGEWIRVILNDGNILQCLISGWISPLNGDNDEQPSYRSFFCTPCVGDCEGEHSMHSEYYLKLQNW